LAHIVHTAVYCPNRFQRRSTWRVFENVVLIELLILDWVLILRAGRCHCQHHTAGDHCERCVTGYYGSPTHGTPNDCQPCPCPAGSNCVQLLDGQVACLDCPDGHTGMRLSLSEEGWWGKFCGHVIKEAPHGALPTTPPRTLSYPPVWILGVWPSIAKYLVIGRRTIRRTNWQFDSVGAPLEVCQIWGWKCEKSPLRP